MIQLFGHPIKMHTAEMLARVTATVLNHPRGYFAEIGDLTEETLQSLPQTLSRRHLRTFRGVGSVKEAEIVKFLGALGIVLPEWLPSPGQNKPFVTCPKCGHAFPLL